MGIYLDETLYNALHLMALLLLALGATLCGLALAIQIMSWPDKKRPCAYCSTMAAATWHFAHMATDGEIMVIIPYCSTHASKAVFAGEDVKKVLRQQHSATLATLQKQFDSVQYEHAAQHPYLVETTPA